MRSKRSKVAATWPSGEGSSGMVWPKSCAPAEKTGAVASSPSGLEKLELVYSVKTCAAHGARTQQCTAWEVHGVGMHHV